MTIARTHPIQTGELIARGIYPSGINIQVLGERGSVGPGLEVDMTPIGAGFPAVATAAAAFQVASSSANDASPAGTGILTVRVISLDATLELQSEDVALSGVAAVALLQARAILDVFALTVGTGGAAAGAITVAETVSGIAHRVIGQGRRRQRDCYTVIPAGLSGIVRSMGGPFGSSIASYILTANRAPMAVGSDVAALTAVRYGLAAAPATGSYPLDPPQRFAAGCVVGVACNNETAGSQLVASSMGITLERL